MTQIKLKNQKWIGHTITQEWHSNRVLKAEEVKVFRKQKQQTIQGGEVYHKCLSGREAPSMKKNLFQLLSCEDTVLRRKERKRAAF